MKIHITHSYFYQLDPKQWANKTPFPPLATITALSYLRSKNVDVSFYDVSLDNGPMHAIRIIEEKPIDLLVIYDDGFNYLTKMCLTNMRFACFEMIKAAKEKGTKVLVSSSDATDQYTLYHEQGADFVLHGEGEETLYEVIQALENSGDFSEITGLSYIKNKEVLKTQARKVRKDLDELPMAAWDAIDFKAYRELWQQSKFPFTINLSTTRGCPFKCNWCAKPIYGNRYNSRSPEKVADEIGYLVTHAGTTSFWITDDIFGLKPGWVELFDLELQKRKLNIQFKIQSRADLLVEDKVVQALSNAGLQEAWIGAESGSQKVLDAMDKGITVEQIEKATHLLQSKNIRIAYFLQFGYPGEGKEEIEKTIAMVQKQQPDDIGISVSYPLPGTVFFDSVKSQLTEKHNWTDSDDLDVMFQGAYPKDFYRILQRYVHHDFRYRQGKKAINGKKNGIAKRYALLMPYNLMVSKRLFRKLKAYDGF